jgi:predicted lipoprotein with Yx(FWY)xxD motif
MKVLIATLAGALLVASGCGSSKSNSAATVSTQKVSGAGTVLVDSKGKALYSPAQEQDGTIRCTGSCTSIWIPLTLPTGRNAPTAASDVPGKLSVVKRPDGKRQVTWNGRPLYTFAEDTGPGSVMGNGATDKFSGMSFTWHVASTGATPPPTTTSGGGGGYGY